MPRPAANVLPAQPSTSSVLALGIGNLICSDDGLGVLAAQQLAQGEALPEGVTVLDGGTLGLALLPYVQEAHALLLLDAVRVPGAPGHLVRLTDDCVVPAMAQRLSVHQLGVADLLAAAKLVGRHPQQLVLLGLVPERVTLGTELSPAVAAQMPTLLDAASAELRRLHAALCKPRARPVGESCGA